MKMAPTESFEVLVRSLPSVSVHWFGPVAVTGTVGVQFQDHPPNATPGMEGAVRVILVPSG